MLNARLPGFAVAAMVLCGVASLTLGEDPLRPDAPTVADGRYFEMRTYHAAPGKLDALHVRFRDHTLRLFKKHGIQSVGYWTPAVEEGANGTLVFLLAYPSKEDREKRWNAFANDPEWKTAKAESEKDGPLVEKVEQVFMTPTDYSPMK